MERQNESQGMAESADQLIDQRSLSRSQQLKRNFPTKSEVTSLQLQQCALTGSKQLDLFVLMEVTPLPGDDLLNVDHAEDMRLSLDAQLELFGVGRKGFL